MVNTFSFQLECIKTAVIICKSKIQKITKIISKYSKCFSSVKHLPHYSELNLPYSWQEGHYVTFPYVRLVFQYPTNNYCTVPKSGKLIFAFEQEFEQKFSLCNQLEKHWGVNDKKSTITFNDANMQTICICYNLLSFITELDIFHKFY